MVDFEVEGVVESDFDGTSNSGGRTCMGLKSAVSVNTPHGRSEGTTVTYNRCSVDACDQFCTRAIAIVVFQQEFPGFLIQGGFRVGIDQQTLDRHEYMTNPIG